MMRSEHLSRTIRKLARGGDLYCRLVVAAQRGRGVRLSADDVEKLVRDEAIVASAEALADQHEAAEEYLGRGR